LTSVDTARVDQEVCLECDGLEGPASGFCVLLISERLVDEVEAPRSGCASVSLAALGVLDDLPSDREENILGLGVSFDIAE
jgi:hypothetical protein